MEIERETNLPAVIHCENHFAYTLFKQPLVKKFFCGKHFIFHFLVFGNAP